VRIDCESHQNEEPAEDRPAEPEPERRPRAVVKGPMATQLSTLTKLESGVGSTACRLRHTGIHDRRRWILECCVLAVADGADDHRADHRRLVLGLWVRDQSATHSRGFWSSIYVGLLACTAVVVSSNRTTTRPHRPRLVGPPSPHARGCDGCPVSFFDTTPAARSSTGSRATRTPWDRISRRSQATRTPHMPVHAAAVNPKA